MSDAPSHSRVAPPSDAIRLDGGRRPVVLHVAQPGSEGVAHYVVDMVRELAADFVMAVAGPSDSVLSRELSSLPVSFHPWNAARHPFNGLLADSRRLDRIIAEVQPDLVHLHSSKAGAVGRLLIRRRLPTVLQPHAWSFQSVGPGMAAVALRWERLAARWTHALIAVSQAESDIAIRNGIRGFGHTEIIANPVDTGRFRPVSADERNRTGSSPFVDVVDPGHKLIVACVGRLCRQKGQDVLVSSVWPQVRTRVPESALVLIGDGPDRAGLQSLADGSVYILGNRTDVDELLRHVDLAVFPSRWEGMSLAMLEAMASGVSIVTSEVGGSAETVGRGAGAVVPLHDTAAWVDAIVSRLQSEGIRTAEGRRGREIVVTAHTDGVRCPTSGRVYCTLVADVDRAESINSRRRVVRR